MFDIDGETFTKEQPEHVYNNGKEKETMNISVCAVRGSKRSSHSEILLFEQSKSLGRLIG